MGMVVFGPVADDDCEGRQANGTADEQRGDAQPGFYLREQRHREPRRCSDEAGEGSGGLMVVHC